MKFLKVMSVVGIMSMMVACSDTTATKEVKEEKPKQEETTKQETTTQETPKPVVTDDAKAKANYGNTMAKHFGNLSELMGKYSELNLKAGSNPSLMKQDKWIKEMSATLVLMDTTIKEIKKVNAPPAFQEVHSLVLKGMDEYQFVVDNYPAAIDNMDAGLLNRCVTAMNNGNTYISQATAKMK